MKDAKELYPDHYKTEQEIGRFYGPYDYQPIINEIGNVLIQVDDNGYQGDSRILYEKNGKYGYLIFGWGSCSGCDALQGCRRIFEIQELMNEIAANVKWFDSFEDLKKYFDQKDWALEYSYHITETKDFINQVLSYTLK